jgi:hypothetical protein
VLAFFALEQKSRCLCYSNTNLTRNDQNGELMRFVEFWQAVTGFAPRWLYFDSKLIDYPEMSRVNQQGIHFVTPAETELRTDWASASTFSTWIAS